MGAEEAQVARSALAAEKIIERAKGTSSKQPRFDADDETFFSSTYWFLKRNELTQRAYRADSRHRDLWLRDTWPMEPYWAAIVKTCALLDANRPWSMTGGRNQVYRYKDIFQYADDGEGWRHFAQFLATAFRTSDLGAIGECGRDGKGGPLRGIYTVDPARCYLTGRTKEPLGYKPKMGKLQKWEPDDYFRITSMVSTDEGMRGLGYCATSMAFELLNLLYGVLTHDQEQVGAKMPKGLLLLKGITQDQWDDALKAREDDLEGQNRFRFGGVMVLATGGAGETPEAVLNSLSQLPSGFDREVFMNQTLYGYAMIVGRDPSEFWPVQTGSIGRGEEPDIQHRKATAKGGAEFILPLQEKLQQELPDTLLFEFEERDPEGELEEAAVAQAWTQVVTTIQGDRTAAAEGVVPRITDEQFLEFLVEKSIIPPEWTDYIEDVEVTDTDAQRDRYRRHVLSSPDLRRAVLQFPSEPIVSVRWTPFRVREKTLFARADEALARELWQGAKVRQDEDEGEVLFDEGDVRITEEDVARAVADAGRRVPGDGTAEDPGLQALITAPTEEEQRGILGFARRLLARRKGEIDEIEQRWTEEEKE